ncbi:response regulator [Paenibacillus chitinolyticus]|uniref:response regulator n=1 Tax=Paenibacillus chitinolyticus TaxID=79263 RepID=UPI00366DC461
MIALLVDDEKHVRSALRMLTKWEEHGISQIFEAENGEEAIEVIRREKPQIIITDMMMPVKGGVELLQWLQTNDPSAKSIVISGHDDFSLVRHTIQYGGTDYILKPIDPDQVNEALAKAVASWNKEEHERSRSVERNIEMNRIKPVYWDRQLSGLLDEPAQNPGAVRDLQADWGLPAGTGSCRIAILSMVTMETKLKNKFGRNTDLLFFSLINICNEFLHRRSRGAAFRYWSSNEILLLVWGEPDKVPALLGDINEGILTALHSRLDFGLSRAHAFPDGLPAAYREARDALRQRNLLSRGGWIHEAVRPEGLQPRRLRFSDFEEAIRTAIRSGSAEEISSAVQAWFDGVRSLSAITLEQIEQWRRESDTMRDRWIEDFFPDGPEELLAEVRSESGSGQTIVPLNEQGTLSLADWQQELTHSFVQLSKQLLKRQHREKNVIYDIAKYLQTHYHEEISLQDIAGRFFLSREYISRKFKQEFGTNLSDYLGAIRIDKAKLLMMNPNLRISQVSEMVGYSDEKYFSKVFKKVTGCSPNEYRKANQPIM